MKGINQDTKYTFEHSCRALEICPHRQKPCRPGFECIFIKDLQRQVYREEIKLLSKGNHLPFLSKLYQMDAFLDQDGILKVGGRLKNASLPSSQKIKFKIKIHLFIPNTCTGTLMQL